MSTYDLLPANTNIRRIQTIPVDTANRIRQAGNEASAAEKIMNLNTKMVDPITLTEIPGFQFCTTVSSTSIPALDITTGNTITVPCFKVCVTGGSTTNEPISVDGLTLVGGFPTACNQFVDPNALSNVLPFSTMTYYRSTGILLPEPATPEVYVLTGTSVHMTNGTYPYWSIDLPNVYSSIQTQGELQFNLCFYLLIGSSGITPL